MATYATPVSPETPRVRTRWSSAPVTTFGPYREAQHLRLLDMMWRDPELEAEFIANPRAVLERETDLDYSAHHEIVALKEIPGEFTFIVPAVPPAAERQHRLDQMNDWYVIGFTLWWMKQRKDAKAAAPFRGALEVAIIQRTFKDEAFRREMLTDPRTALGDELGASFPDWLKVMSLEDTKDRTHLIVPKNPARETLIDQSEHLAGWFAAMHQFWWWMVSARVHTPIPGTPITEEMG